MWLIKKSPRASEKRLQIRARLKRGETLHITFNDEEDPRGLEIQGSGEIRLAVNAQHDFKAEVVRGE